MLSHISRSARSLAVARPSTRLFSISANRMADNDKSSLDAKKGSVGETFEDGKAAQAAEKVGGPFSRDGTVGKEFTKDGKVGGTAQKVAEEMQGEGESGNHGLFDKQGAIGSQFQPGGNIAKAGEAVGGPFASDGAIGKQFKADGAIGSTVQENLGGKK